MCMLMSVSVNADTLINATVDKHVFCTFTRHNSHTYICTNFFKYMRERERERERER